MILKDFENIQDAKERIKFLKENRKAIIKAKKFGIKSTEPLNYSPSMLKDVDAFKALSSDEEGVFTIVGNSVGFMDAHDDVSMMGSFNKTVSENGHNVRILKDHDYSTDSIFAKNLGVSILNIPIKSLGYDAEGTTEIVAAKIAPIYDTKMKSLYENGEIKQHSIGLQYVKIELALNDPSDNEGFANWEQYIGKVINRERAEKRGYFFAVLEQKIHEISAVVFGSNEFTPTLEDTKNIEPSKDTQQTEPSKDTQNNNKQFLINQIKNLNK